MGMRILRLMIVTLLPVIAVAVIDRYENKKVREQKWSIQLVYGLVFGLIAIACARYGIKVGDASVNTRDAVPIVAGLFVGGPAGIVAGMIAALERYISISFGSNTFTVVADTATVLIAGIVAAVLRKVLFDDRRPNWFMAMFTGFVIEVLHFSLIFSTNMSKQERVIKIVHHGTTPMILLNGLVVMLASFVLYLFIPGQKIFRRRTSAKPIFVTIQTWLLNVIVVSFLAVSILMILLESNLAYSQINEQFSAAMDEVANDVIDASDRYQINLTQMIASDIEDGDHDLDSLAEWYNVAEINVIDKNGIIRASTQPDFIGFDMGSGEQSAEFLCLLDREKEYAQTYRPISADDNTYMKYAGVRMGDGFVQMGYNAENFHQELNKELKLSLRNRHVGKTGFFIVFDEHRWVVATSSSYQDNYRFAVNQIDFDKLVPNKVVKMKINKDQYYCMYDKTEGYDLMAFCSVEDAMTTGIISIYIAVYNMILVFSLLFIAVYILIKKLVVNQILSMAGSLARITEGHLDEVVNVRSNAEFSSLSDDINTTVDTLKRYIAEAASRIDAELEFAKSIQLSAMPNHFPAFPSRTDMDIYARMDTAKEVGGDFYDFYFTDNDTFHFMVADVSGKGIPAAMFMMRAKSVLRGQAGIGHEINEVFTQTNEMLCAENEANMFVTAWQGRIDLKTGQLSVANAGHNPPLIKRKDGSFEYLRLKPNLVLASMEGISYRKHEMQLEPGDILYLYTDGVTEATNSENVLYGEDRLITLLNSRTFDSLQEICDAVKADIDVFVGDAPQFDDITMVAFEYKG